MRWKRPPYLHVLWCEAIIHTKQKSVVLMFELIVTLHVHINFHRLVVCLQLYIITYILCVCVQCIYDFISFVRMLQLAGAILLFIVRCSFDLPTICMQQINDTVGGYIGFFVSCSQSDQILKNILCVCVCAHSSCTHVILSFSSTKRF